MELLSLSLGVHSTVRPTIRTFPLIFWFLFYSLMCHYNKAWNKINNSFPSLRFHPSYIWEGEGGTGGEMPELNSEMWSDGLLRVPSHSPSIYFLYIHPSICPSYLLPSIPLYCVTSPSTQLLQYIPILLSVIHCFLNSTYSSYQHVSTYLSPTHAQGRGEGEARHAALCTQC